MQKLQAIRAQMRAQNMDAILIFQEIHQFYLTDFPFSDGMVLLTQNSAHLITDFRYYEAAEAKVGALFTVEMPKDPLAYVQEVLEKEGCRSLGVEEHFLAHRKYLSLQKKFSKQALLSCSEIFTAMRQVKGAEEIARIKKAQALTDRAFAHILSVMHPKMTEIEVALELEFFMRKNGAEGVAFETIAVSGTASALPHGTPRNLPLQAGFLTMDFGARVQGYCADMTRTVVLGKATAEMKKVYETVLHAQASVLEVISAGVTGKEMDGIARDIIDGAGYRGCFGHSLGHGVGLFIHEEPRLSPRAEERLELGNIVTVEPGIYLAGQYGCRIEDMICVEKDGCYNFTQSKKDLIELF